MPLTAICCCIYLLLIILCVFTAKLKQSICGLLLIIQAQIINQNSDLQLLTLKIAYS